MIPFSGLSRFSGHFGGDGPSPLNRDTTVVSWRFEITTSDLLKTSSTAKFFLIDIPNSHKSVFVAP